MPSNLNLDYYYGSEGEQYSFYRIPKALLTDPWYKGVSIEAKVLYGLLLDRMGLSVKNGWMDSGNRVYIYFTQEDAMALMNCGKDKATKLFRELDQGGIGLIERKKQGQGRPTRIYVKNFILPPDLAVTSSASLASPQAAKLTRCAAPALPTEPASLGFGGDPSWRQQSQDPPPCCPQTAENRQSGPLDSAALLTAEKPQSAPLETRGLDGGFSAPNKTEKNKTDPNDTDLSILPPTPAPPAPAGRSKGQMRMDEMDRYRELIKEHIDYDLLLTEHPYEEETLEGYVELMVEVCCSRRDFIRVAGEEIATGVVKSRFLKLNHEHIAYVLESMSQNTTLVKNIKAYTLAALYNAPTTIGQYYASLVSHDLAQDAAGT